MAGGRSEIFEGKTNKAPNVLTEQRTLDFRVRFFLHLNSKERAHAATAATPQRSTKPKATTSPFPRLETESTVGFHGTRHFSARE